MALLQGSSMARQIYEYAIEKIIDHTQIIREVILNLKNAEEFNFKAGQFVMLHVPTESGKPALRAYSIASSDSIKKTLTLIFKFVENGVASKFIWDLKGTETLQFTGPFGKVFFQEPPTEQVVFLNTGSGLSQHYCFLKSKAHLYPHIKYHLLFGIRTEADIYYQKELEQLKKDLPNFNYSYVLSRPSPSWTGKKGYVQNFIKDFNPKDIPTTFYLCGNGAMIKDSKALIIDEMGIDKSQVWAEAFD